MLNAFRYLAIMIMLLAVGEAAWNLVGVAASFIPSTEETAAEGDAADTESATPKDAPSLVQRASQFLSEIVNAFGKPLFNFWFGAILFVVVRIARDQAHDLAID